MCEAYLVSNHRSDIINILEHPDNDKCFSVNINFLDLFESDTNLGNALLSDPENSLKDWNVAVLNVQNNLLEEYDKKIKVKDKVTCRIHSLPPWPHVSRTIFPGNNDADSFLQITGTVVRMSERKLLEYQRHYVCIKCKYPIIVEAQYDKRNIIKMPKKCTNPEGCSSKKILSFGDLDSLNCKDYQEVKIQENVAKLNVGTVPNTIIVSLEDDLVNICKPGENITVTGIVKRRWSEFEKGVKIVVDIVLKANHVQINSSALNMAVGEDIKQSINNFWLKYQFNSLSGRNVILNSISPEIFGLNLVKLAIAIVLAGGSQSIDSIKYSGIDTRSESHLLLVGDPGTGKSQMLKFASRIIARSVLTTGVGSTAAGLTVTAIMENGDWHLEAGALVMADGGICCIDEFNSMREHDRTSIHEAMEQQSISVAKAGMVCRLKTRCSILAACNPKGNIDVNQPLCMNVAMSGPLLSRFDLVLLLRDIVNEENDQELANFLLCRSADLEEHSESWSLEQLQAYFLLIKKLNPTLTNDAEIILSSYYQLQRKFGSKNKSRTTVRLLESLIRLSQGHAKLMFHPEVLVMDTIFPIILVDNSLDYDSSLFNLKLDNNAFLDNPDQLYLNYLTIILEKLNLIDILTREMEYLGVERKQDNETRTSERHNQEGDENSKYETSLEGLLFSQQPEENDKGERNKTKKKSNADSKEENNSRNESKKNKDSDFLFSQNWETVKDQGDIEKDRLFLFSRTRDKRNEELEISDVDKTNKKQKEINTGCLLFSQKKENNTAEERRNGQQEENDANNTRRKAKHVKERGNDEEQAKNRNIEESTNKMQEKLSGSQKCLLVQELDEILMDVEEPLKNFTNINLKMFQRKNPHKKQLVHSGCKEIGELLKKETKKKEKPTEVESLKVLPSVNDDFCNLNIDFYCADSTNSIGTEVEEKHSDVAAKPPLNIKNTTNLLSRFQFIPKDLRKPRENSTTVIKEQEKLSPVQIVQFAASTEKNANIKRNMASVMDKVIKVSSVQIAQSSTINEKKSNAPTVMETELNVSPAQCFTFENKSSKERNTIITKETEIRVPSLQMAQCPTTIEKNVNKEKLKNEDKKEKFKFKRLRSLMDFSKLDNDINKFDVDSLFPNDCESGSRKEQTTFLGSREHNKREDSGFIEVRQNSPSTSGKAIQKFKSNFPTLNLEIDDFDVFSIK